MDNWPWVSFVTEKINYSFIDAKTIEKPTIHRLTICSIDTFIKVLKSGRFDINSQDQKGNTLLMSLTVQSNFEKIIELLKYKPNVEMKNIHKHNVFFLIWIWSYEKRDIEFTNEILSILDDMLRLSDSVDILTCKNDVGDDLASFCRKNLELSPMINSYFLKKSIILFDNHFKRSMTFFSLMLCEINHKK